jgi:hypothetical protein
MSKKRLSDAVNEVFERILDGEKLDARTSATGIWDEIDADGQYMAGIEGVTSRIKAKCQSIRMKANISPERQEQLNLGLPIAVAMDVDGHRMAVTRDLAQEEVRRAIEIRKLNRDAIIAEIKKWEDAELACKPHWARHPKWTFGQCLDAVTRAILKKKPATT